MPPPRKSHPERYCERCSSPIPQRDRNGHLRQLSAHLKQRFCSRECMGLAKVGQHNPNCTITGHHIYSRKQVPKGPCAQCGAPNALDVHHKDGNWRNNVRENLERICRSCHKKEHYRLKPREHDPVNGRFINAA